MLLLCLSFVRSFDINILVILEYSYCYPLTFRLALKYRKVQVLFRHDNFQLCLSSFESLALCFDHFSMVALVGNFHHTYIQSKSELVC